MAWERGSHRLGSEHWEGNRLIDDAHHCHVKKNIDSFIYTRNANL